MGKSSFQDTWFRNPSYCDWIGKDQTNRYIAKCVLCVKNIDISNMGEPALKSHAASKKHQKLMEDRKKSVSVSTLFEVTSKNR